MLRLALLLVLAAGVAGCEPRPIHNSADVERLAKLEADLNASQAQVAKLKADAADHAFQQERAERMVKTPAVIRASVEEPKVDMCYKDYCPCDPPQGGPDTVLCDQLEEGIQPKVDMMIAGRAMREARRQIETGDY